MLQAENCDLYDVLVYIAFHANMVTRSTRAWKAQTHLSTSEPRQQKFLRFVLQQYELKSVEKPDESKLGDLLMLKYHAIADAKRSLGDIPTIRNIFIGFQGYLYA